MVGFPAGGVPSRDSSPSHSRAIRTRTGMPVACTYCGVAPLTAARRVSYEASPAIVLTAAHTTGSLVWHPGTTCCVTGVTGTTVKTDEAAAARRYRNG
jgi:hypothetical protein